MRRVGLAVVLLVCVGGGSAQADGCPPLSCGTTASPQPGAASLAVRSEGLRGPLASYDVRTGRTRFTLPRGIPSADGRRFVAAVTRKPATRVTVYDAGSGRKRATFVLRGRWVLAGVSATGRFAAFVGAGDRPRHTGIRVVDVERRRVAWRTSLRGGYDVEAVSRDGQRLFLVHLRNNGYDLELYDRRRRSLRGNPDPDAPGFMTGQAWMAIASRNGRWLHTLYVRGDGHTFVHALDLVTARPRCIDLPAKGGFDIASAGAAALVLSPGERILYVVNPLIGAVWTVDPSRSRVLRTVRFRPLAPSSFIWGLWPAAALTADGRTLVFGAGRSLWWYDTTRGRVSSSQRVPGPTGRRKLEASITALAFAPDGRRLLVLRANRKLGPLFLQPPR